MKHFYLLRHTVYDNPENIFHGRLPLDLSREGRGQAQKIAAWFKDKHIARIYSSAVKRCRSMSKIVSKAIGAPVSFDKRLLEILTVIQGMNMDAYRKDKQMRFANVSELGGESMMDIQIRMLDFFYEKMKSEKENIIICSHGDPLYFLYLGLAKRNLPETVDAIDRSEYQKKGTVRRVDIEGEKYSIGPIIEP